MTDEPQVKPPKQRRIATSLADLKAPKFGIILEYPDDDFETVVPVEIPPAYEWNKIGRSVPQPVPPISGVDANKRPIYDRNDPGYIQQVQEVQDEITYRRLLRCIQFPIEGDTLEEKITALKEALGPAAFWQLNAKISEKIAEVEARIVNRSETFHGNGTSDAARVPGERVDTFTL
jgi:hypothetical protein